MILFYNFFSLLTVLYKFVFVLSFALVFIKQNICSFVNLYYIYILVFIKINKMFDSHSFLFLYCTLYLFISYFYIAY